MADTPTLTIPEEPAPAERTDLAVREPDTLAQRLKKFLGIKDSPELTNHDEPHIGF
jgi:hypothetical protein